MPERVEDISRYEKNSLFYGEFEAILTVKSFDLKAIRKRYIQSKSNVSGKSGSVERRKPSIGGLVQIKLKNGAITGEQILTKIKEPRGLDRTDSYFGFAAENAVFVIGEEGELFELRNAWFSYIHTVKFHPNIKNRLLISSSGFDLILEYNFKNDAQTFEWLAWENGFNKAIDPETGNPVYLTRSPVEYQELKNSAKHATLINNPAKDHLPTAKRAAFINSVTYDSPDTSKLLATFFHTGSVMRIDMNSGGTSKILQGLKNPHGGQRYNERIMATSTGTGEIFVRDGDYLIRYALHNLPGKPTKLKNMEWVQNTHSFGNYLIAIDSNRTSFVIIDPANKLYDQIPFNENWAVQDLTTGELNQAQIACIAELKK